MGVFSLVLFFDYFFYFLIFFSSKTGNVENFLTFSTFQFFSSSRGDERWEKFRERVKKINWKQTRKNLKSLTRNFSRISPIISPLPFTFYPDGTSSTIKLNLTTNERRTTAENQNLTYFILHVIFRVFVFRCLLDIFP